MDENNTVRKFQIARLDEWIGDYESADKIYEEIKKLDDKLSQVFKNTIRKRQGKLNHNIDLKCEKETDCKRKIDDNQEINYKQEKYIKQEFNYVKSIAENEYIEEENYFIDDYRIIKNNTELLYDDNLLAYQKLNYSKLSDNVMKWKYSVSVISKVKNDLRIEIRGYIPKGVTPLLNKEFPKEISDWNINCNKQFSKEITYLVELNALNKIMNTEMYMSIDKWGLLSGTIIGDENKLGNILLSIEAFIIELSRLL